MKMKARVETRAQKPALVFFSLCLLVMATADTIRADASHFDLSGPSIEMKVSRNGKSLPIASVPNLQGGDRLWIQADFPENQSEHYLLIVAFLRGPTNPPPENWFTVVETWNRKIDREGTLVTVPADAQQALLFLTPATSGALSTLRSTVRGKPGVFVRASQQLEQASLDRTRLDEYMEKIRQTSNSDTPLVERSALLSQTLYVKADPDCFNKPVEQQESCVMHDTNALTLEDAPYQSLMATLTSGASADLVGTFGSSPAVGKGYYSPYIGSAMDLVRLLSGIHTAEFQYLPALALPKQYDMALRLNSAPSFRNPKSVLVIGLPPIEKASVPALRPVDPKQVFCLENSSLVLPVTGAPLVFSTEMAHDFRLQVRSQSGDAVELPAIPDAARGGFVIDTRELEPGKLDTGVTGTLHGLWGFDAYEGPSFQFRNAHAGQWTIPAAEANDLLIGRQDTVHLESGCAVCVEQLSALDSKGKEIQSSWKAMAPEKLEVRLSLHDETAGTLVLMVKQFGLPKPDAITLRAYSEAAHLERFTIYAGDDRGVLTGTQLDEVASVDLNGTRFVPRALSRTGQDETLELATAGEPVKLLTVGEEYGAHVSLRDGRALELQTAVEPPRPKVTLVSKSAQAPPSASAIRLGSEDELPQDRPLSFLLKTEVPSSFPRDEQIEVATVDNSADTFLSVTNGGLVLQDADNVLAVLDPLKNLGASAFGPLQFRPVDGERKGDWQPLVKLVRIPALREVRCPATAEEPCVLNGSNMFLLDSVASDQQFSDAVPVPTGYADTKMKVPRPSGTLLYIKLRDDPSIVDTLTLPVLPDNY